MTAPDRSGQREHADFLGSRTGEAQMEGLPRPEVPPGAQHDLVDALHALHHEAGWPSLRTLARKAGCSHTTVSTVLSSPQAAVVGCAGAGRRGDGRGWRGVPPVVAGREQSRRVSDRPPILESRAAAPSWPPCGVTSAPAPGSLLVTGEAGIGKTRLVDTRERPPPHDVFVARGNCLPLSDAGAAAPGDRPAALDLRGRPPGQWIKEGPGRVGRPYVASDAAPPAARSSTPSDDLPPPPAGGRLVAAAALLGGRYDVRRSPR